MFMEFNEWIDNYVNDDITKEALAKWNKEIEENKHVKIAREQGIEIGKEQNKKEIAKSMLRKGYSINEIAEISGLTMEAINDLKEDK